MLHVSLPVSMPAAREHGQSLDGKLILGKALYFQISGMAHASYNLHKRATSTSRLHSPCHTVKSSQ